MVSVEKNVGQNSIKFSFPAALDNIDDAVAKMERFLLQKKLEEFSFEVILVSREALINAAVHGSELNPDKTVKLELRVEPDGLVIAVEDQGPGFDWQGRLKKERPGRDVSGRGLYIMKTYCDEILYNEAGNRLTLMKKIEQKQ
ncbi:MAG: ATP-binding protein [Deltaproteobacteria bacterium]|nr:ATP-binding protein [Deltaproteobacteria bacterium]